MRTMRVFMDKEAWCLIPRSHRMDGFTWYEWLGIVVEIKPKEQ